jgi:formylglycine-generating enzyme required for sulfatase activity
MKNLLFVFALLFALPAHADSVLRITCEEQDLGAEITVNGEFKGECPLDLKVKPGELKIQVKKPINEDWEKGFSKDMRIGDGVVQKIEAKLVTFWTNAYWSRVKKEQTAADARWYERDLELAPVLAEYQQNDIKPGNGKTFKDCDACPEMLLVPGNQQARIGSNSDNEASPRHLVRIVSFALARTEVTQAQWQALMGNNPGSKHNSKACDGDCPVNNVSWYDAQAYVKKLSEVTGKPYRLPSESEWEYACGAGKDGGGGGIGDKYCGGNDLQAVAVAYVPPPTYVNPNGADRPQKVGQKAPNAWGLFDMSGNVEEWVEDCYHFGYAVNNGAPIDGSAWTSYPQSRNPNERPLTYTCDNARVVRGGDVKFSRYVGGATSLDRTYRKNSSPEYGLSNRGFRVAMTLDMTEQDMPRYVERECKQRADSLANFYAKARLGEVVSVDRATKRIEVKLDAPAAENKSEVKGYAITKTRKKLAMSGSVVAGATNLALVAKEIADVSPGDTYIRNATKFFGGCWGSTAYCALVKQTCPN